MVDTQLVIDLYESGLGASDIAKRLDCSCETVRRKLRKAGYDLGKLRKKYCPALVVMLRTVGNMRFTDICTFLGMSSQAVNSIIRRAGLADKSRRQSFDIDAIEREYLAGASTYALGEKYGVCRQTITKWMNKRGHARYKGYMPKQSKHPSGSHKGHETQRIRAIEKVREKALNDSGGTIELIEWRDQYNIKFKCLECGSIFSRIRSKHPIVCPHCRSLRIEKEKAERERIRNERALNREQELAIAKHCVICGSVFYSEYQNKKFCSDKCRKKDQINKKLERDRKKTALKQAAELRKDKTCAQCGVTFHSIYETKKYCDKCASLHRYCDHKERAKRYGVKYDPSVTLEKLIERDNNVCQICGETCDKTDRRYGSYGPLSPSTDHIIAMVNGGGHIWSNVQLAHVICNAIKRDLSEEELTEEVITHAKEQAIAYKCA